jgi:hypothetical protein
MKKWVDEYIERETAHRQRQNANANVSGADDEHPVNPTENLSDIISHYADVNMLSPPEEVVPNGVVMLLTSLHDKLAHRVRCKEVLADEKVSSTEALRERVNELIADHDNSEDKLYIARVECEKEVIDTVGLTRQSLADFRDEYAALKAVSLAKQRHDRSARRSAEAHPEMKFKDKKTK